MVILEEINFFFKEHKKISNIYFIILAILLISIPFSKFGISVSEFSLLGLWFFSFKYKDKLKTLYANKTAIIFITIYLLYLVGLLYTNDMKFGLHSIKIKLPLILFPVVLLSIPAFSKKQLKVLMYIFVAAIFAKTLETTTIILLANNPFDDIRRISSISHIRFSIFIIFSIYVLVYYFFINQKNKILSLKFIIPKLLIIWFFLFLFIIQSITGIFIFFIISYILFFYFTLKNKKIIFNLISIIIPISIFFYILLSINNFYNVKIDNFDELEKKTANNILYSHDTTRLEIENGNYVWIYLCEKELSQNWNKVSEIKYDSLDNMGHELKYTLIRYLTSKGYNKDSIGIYKLTNDDILNIENGIANYKFYNKYNFNNRVYKIIWQIDIYMKGGNPSGHSVTQRIEFLKTAMHIIKKNPIFGVGTGDIKKMLANQYEKDDSILNLKFRKFTHNQYVTFATTLGIVGFLWIGFAIFFPFFKNKKYKHLLPTVFFLISIISMLNEDTWETQISVTFFALLYSLFILPPESK